MSQHPTAISDHTSLTAQAARLRARLLSEDVHHEYWSWIGHVSLQQVPLGLVDVRRSVSRLQILQAPRWSEPQQRFHVLPELALRLECATRRLPVGYALGFWEGYRPLNVQRQLWETGLGMLRENYPHHGESELESLLDIFIARPTAAAPHTLGQAVDVALIDHTGQVQDSPDDLLLLSDTLVSAGLTSYDPEWWHWSYEETKKEFFQ